MYKTILLSIDLGAESSWEKAMPEAVRIAKDHEAELHVIAVVPDFGMSIVGNYFPEDYESKVTKDATDALRKLAEKYVPGGMKVTLHISMGAVYDRIMSKANKLNADLIVMASHQPKTQDYLLGRNAARVVRHAKQSVLIVRN
jgi:nucleotide-binding universal stress UspA family protein